MLQHSYVLAAFYFPNIYNQERLQPFLTAIENGLIGSEKVKPIHYNTYTL